jgi:hypothetical protein
MSHILFFFSSHIRPKYGTDVPYACSPDGHDFDQIGYPRETSSAGLFMVTDKQGMKREAGSSVKSWKWRRGCHSRMNRFRKLAVRYEKKTRNYPAQVEFACIIIIWRNLIPVHLGLIPG